MKRSASWIKTAVFLNGTSRTNERLGIYIEYERQCNPTSQSILTETFIYKKFALNGAI